MIIVGLVILLVITIPVISTSVWLILMIFNYLYDNNFLIFINWIL